MMTVILDNLTSNVCFSTDSFWKQPGYCFLLAEYIVRTSARCGEPGKRREYNNGYPCISAQPISNWTVAGRRMQTGGRELWIQVAADISQPSECQCSRSDAALLYQEDSLYVIPEFKIRAMGNDDSCIHGSMLYLSCQCARRYMSRR